MGLAHERPSCRTVLLADSVKRTGRRIVMSEEALGEDAGTLRYARDRSKKNFFF